MIKKALTISGAAALIFIMAISAMHEPHHQYRELRVQDPVVEAQDYDFLMHDLEQARKEANEAYRKITHSGDRVIFDPTSLYDKP